MTSFQCTIWQPLGEKRCCLQSGIFCPENRWLQNDELWRNYIHDGYILKYQWKDNILKKLCTNY